MNSKQTLEFSHVTVHGTLSTSIVKHTATPFQLISTLLLVRLSTQEDFDVVVQPRILRAFLGELPRWTIISKSWHEGV